MFSKFMKAYFIVFLSLCILKNFGISPGIAADFEERSKTALITGANKGIGFELTKLMLGCGDTVYAVARHTKPLESLKTTYPDRLHIIKADLGTVEGQNAVAPAVTSMLNFVVHNAATMDPVGDGAMLDSSKTEALRSMLNVNGIAPIILTNMLGDKFMPLTRHLFVSSRAGDTMFKGIIPYCVTKHVLDAFVEGLRTDHPDILAATIHPGEVDTHMQSILRAPAESDFALAPVFVKTHTEGRLLAPLTAARFFKWVLCGASDDEFVSRKHNMYVDKSTYPHWVPEGVTIVNPYPDSGASDR
ncbi:MAG: SDR family NAD(P)-dependent oxidoreductase [Alphaproteobacteria bacterium]|nr:SDR family NAD(P)-dependent oxidoreductase [Alphaproteobacteria bacterium]